MLMKMMRVERVVMMTDVSRTPLIRLSPLYLRQPWANHIYSASNPIGGQTHGDADHGDHDDDPGEDDGDDAGESLSL